MRSTPEAGRNERPKKLKVYRNDIVKYGRGWGGGWHRRKRWLTDLQTQRREGVPGKKDRAMNIARKLCRIHGSLRYNSNKETLKIHWLGGWSLTRR